MKSSCVFMFVVCPIDSKPSVFLINKKLVLVVWSSMLFATAAAAAPNKQPVNILRLQFCTRPKFRTADFRFKKKKEKERKLFAHTAGYILAGHISVVCLLIRFPASGKKISHTDSVLHVHTLPQLHTHTRVIPPLKCCITRL